MMDMDQLLMQQFDAPLDTVRLPHPVGDFSFTVDTDYTKMKIDQGTSESGRAWARFSCMAHTSDPVKAIENELGRPPAVFVSIMLDLDEQGNISQGKGQNTELGQFLEACGLKKAGWSFREVPGKVFKARVGHRPNPNKPGQVIAEIVAYTKP